MAIEPIRVGLIGSCVGDLVVRAIPEPHSSTFRSKMI